MGDWPGRFQKEWGQKMKASYFLKSGMLALAALVAFIVAYPHLPEQMPIHWNWRGEVDGYGSRWALLLMGPGLMLGAITLFSVLPWLSPKRFEVDVFQPTYLYLMLIVVAISGYFFAVVLWAALTGSVDAFRIILGGVSVLIALIGNVMGKVRRNFFIGIRTPWTLASERVWYATHRLAGKLMVGTGFICLIVAWIGAAPWIWITLLLAGLLAPVPYSLFYYKKLEKRGELDVAM